MSTSLIDKPAQPAPDAAQQAKLARRMSRRQGLFAPDLLKTALKQAFVMLRPDIQWKNPVMFVVEVGTFLSVLYTIAKVFSPAPHQPSLGYLLALDGWLFLTVLFANFASALAEARGKAQADTLRKTRQETPAYRLAHANDAQTILNLSGPIKDILQEGKPGASLLETTDSTKLKAGD